MLVIVVAIFTVIGLQAQKKTTQEEQKMEKEHVEFRAQLVIPMSLPQKDVSGDNYFIQISEEEIVSELPYLGTAHRAMNPERDKGMRFKGKPENFVLVKNNGQTTINASVKTESDEFNISLSASSSGYATLIINSRNRETITYRGEIK